MENQGVVIVAWKVLFPLSPRATGALEPAARLRLLCLLRQGLVLKGPLKRNTKLVSCLFFADPCHCSTPSLAPTIFVVLICPRCAHSCLNFVLMVRWNAVFTPSPLAPGVCCVGHKPWCPRVIIPDPPLVSGLPRLPSVCFFLPCTTRIARKFAATPWESPT